MRLKHDKNGKDDHQLMWLKLVSLFPSALTWLISRGNPRTSERRGDESYCRVWGVVSCQSWLFGTPRDNFSWRSEWWGLWPPWQPWRNLSALPRAVDNVHHQTSPLERHQEGSPEDETKKIRWHWLFVLFLPSWISTVSLKEFTRKAI